MSRFSGSLCVAIIAGCSARAIDESVAAGDDAASEGVAPIDPTTSTSSTGGPTTSEASGAPAPSDVAGPIVCGREDADIEIEQCAPGADDCPAGEKCVWYVDAHHGWKRRDAARCVPVVGDVPPFHPCTLPCGVGRDIRDDCDERSYCLEVYGGSDAGFCAPYWIETWDCSSYPGTAPAGENGSNFPAACLFYDCDPFDPESCAEGMTCMFYPAFFYGSRMCWFAPEALSLPLGAACDHETGCGDGKLCLDAHYLPDCASDRCCTQWCELDDPVCDDDAMVCEAYQPYPKTPFGACVPPGTFGR